jgi:hypothetical protein
MPHMPRTWPRMATTWHSAISVAPTDATEKRTGPGQARHRIFFLLVAERAVSSALRAMQQQAQLGKRKAVAASVPVTGAKEAVETVETVDRDQRQRYCRRRGRDRTSADEGQSAHQRTTDANGNLATKVIKQMMPLLLLLSCCCLH